MYIYIYIYTPSIIPMTSPRHELPPPAFRRGPSAESLPPPQRNVLHGAGGLRVASGGWLLMIHGD